MIGWLCHNAGQAEHVRVLDLPLFISGDIDVLTEANDSCIPGSYQATRPRGPSGLALPRSLFVDVGVACTLCYRRENVH
jgi:hypothetical protein